MTEVDDGPDAEDAADSRHGRRASRHGGVHPAVRRAGRRSDRADRSHAGRHADRRRVRHHHAAAPQGPQHRRALQGRPACRTRRAAARSSPAGRRRRRRSAVRARDRPAPGDAGVPRPGRRATTSTALMHVLRGRPQGTAISSPASRRRSRRFSRARSSCSASRRAGHGAPPGSALPHRRSRARVAPVVLHLGHGARCRAAEGRPPTAG